VAYLHQSEPPRHPATKDSTVRLSNLSFNRDLSLAPRRFLAFAAFNVISWQCLCSAAMILYARKLDMPASWVGALIAAMPLANILVLVTIPLVTRFGSKRLMMTMWVMRCLCMGSVFFIPFVTSRYGNQAGWYLLLSATLGFCILRSIGAGGWLPWLHEIVPKNERGLYFSAESRVANFMSILALLLVAFLLGGDAGQRQYLGVYALGIVAGFISLAYMMRVPGGAPHPHEEDSSSGFSAYRSALLDRRFLSFTLVASLCLTCMTFLSSVTVLYMRDILLLTSRTIMFIAAGGCLGIVLTVQFWGMFADHSGSGRAMFKTILAYALIALTVLLLSPSLYWSRILIGPTLILASTFGGAFWSTSHRGVLNYVQERGKIAYTSVWTVSTSMALGVTPIITGFVVHDWGVTGFRFCFATSAIGGIACALLCLVAVQDGPRPVKPSVASLINPILPVRTLARIAWITVGLHESRPTRPNDDSD
jgi:MFS family permease